MASIHGPLGYEPNTPTTAPFRCIRKVASTLQFRLHLAQGACMTLVPQTLTLYICWRRPATLEVASSILTRRGRALGVVVLRQEVFATLVVFWPDA